MGAKSFRTADTSEEAKLISVFSVLDFAREISANPSLMKQLSAEASTALDQLGAQKQKHQEALADIAAAASLRDELDRARAAIEDRKAALEKAHEDKVAQLSAAKAQLAAEHTLAVAEVLKKEEVLKARAQQVDAAALAASASRMEAGRRHDELDRRAKADEDAHEAAMKAVEISLADRTAKLNKREKALDAKAEKIEELKKALKDD